MSHRYELYYKSRAQLLEIKQLLINRSNMTTPLQVLFTNKSKEDKNLSDASALSSGSHRQTVEGPATKTVDITSVFSLKANWVSSGTMSGPPQKRTDLLNANKESTFKIWRDFIDNAPASGINQVLLVSGFPKKPLDTIEVLERESRYRQQQEKPSSSVRIGVAFTPYYPLAEEAAEERKRLVAKLKTGLVTDVWLQFGGTPLRLKEELSWLKTVLAELPVGSMVQIHGSMFVPSAQWLQRFKFRPWTGIFLPDGFLESLETAEAGCASILRVYEEFGVHILVESSTYNEKDMKRNQDFFERFSCSLEETGKHEGASFSVDNKKPEKKRRRLQ